MSTISALSVNATSRDFRGSTAAALNISAPKFRLGRGLATAGREVRAAADHLTRALTEAPKPASTRRIS